MIQEKFIMHAARLFVTNNGYTLLELTLILFIGSFCILICTTILIFYSQESQRIYSEAQLLDNARYIQSVLFTEVSTAGFIGCRNLQNANITYWGVPADNYITLKNSFIINNNFNVAIKKLS